MVSIIFWGELIAKYITININSKTVFTDYAMLKLIFYSPHKFSLYCQSLCDVIHSTFSSWRGRLKIEELLILVRHVKNKHEQTLYRKDIKLKQIRIDAQHMYT